MQTHSESISFQPRHPLTNLSFRHQHAHNPFPFFSIPSPRRTRPTATGLRLCRLDIRAAASHQTARRWLFRVISGRRLDLAPRQRYVNRSDSEKRACLSFGNDDKCRTPDDWMSSLLSQLCWLTWRFSHRFAVSHRPWLPRRRAYGSAWSSVRQSELRQRGW